MRSVQHLRAKEFSVILPRVQNLLSHLKNLKHEGEQRSFTVELYLKYLVLTERRWALLLFFPFLFSLPDEKFGEAVFKLTDCPRDVGHSAIPPDKEDLIRIFVKKKCYIIISRPSSVQDNNKKKIIIKDNICHVFLSSWNQRSSLPTEW